MLLNLSVFAWYGAVCPWVSFAHNDVIPVYRLIALGILVLLFRRIPVIYALHWNVWQLRETRQMLFAGYFGPIGVGAVFYLHISLDFLEHVTVDDVIRDDAARLQEITRVIVWFLVMCSIVSLFYSCPECTILMNGVGGPWLECAAWQSRLPCTQDSVRFILDVDGQRRR